jgi:hypothetical protein
MYLLIFASNGSRQIINIFLLILSFPRKFFHINVGEGSADL